jgi:hypothetical protein
MIAPNPDSPCRQAELYYYDFLFAESHEFIPEPIVNHIAGCEHCQQQLNQLEDILSQPECHPDSEQAQIRSAVTTMLKLHFGYIDKPVTCNVARPFLPALLDPALEIRIPTPVTAHLDHCQECSEDLETIRKLNLNSKQLCHLSQLFAEKPGEDKVACSQAQAATFAIVLMHFQETSQAVLKHICVCPNCRKSLYRYRDDFCNELLCDDRAQAQFRCEQLSSADIFDYAIPYGLDPANDQYAKFRQPLTSHVRGCPTCLGKMQQLHNTVYEIAERPESDVVTIYHIDESAKTRAASEPNTPYSGFPIRVEVVGREDRLRPEQPASAISFADALKRNVSSLSAKPWIKAGLAAAAVILVALALFLKTPSAEAVTIDQIYKALERVANVYIASFVPDREEPTQEIWVSRQLRIYMTRTGNELRLWDIRNRVEKVKQVGEPSIETTFLSDETAAKMQEVIASFWALVPVADIFLIPDGAQWHRVPKDSIKAVAGSDTYDLTWTEKKYGGAVVFRKWRVFLQPETNLPQRTELYQKQAGDDEYTLKAVKVADYVNESEIQAVLEEASF